MCGVTVWHKITAKRRCPGARLAVPELVKFVPVDTTRTRRELGMEFIPADEAVTAMGRSLIELNLV